jgi:DNA polymerase
MRWTERQRAMLREIGIRLWAPEVAPEETAAAAPTATPRQRVVESPLSPLLGQRAIEATPSPSLGQRAVEATSSAPRWPGLAPADWLVVAEPLDGADPQQAQLLENMLRAIGVGVVAPSRERRAAFCPLPIGAAEGTAAAPAALRTALDTVAPRCVLALGRAAAAALLGDDVPLGSLRGRVHLRAGVPVVVTFSIAFLLRHPAEKAKAWADLCLAAGTLAGPAAA